MERMERRRNDARVSRYLKRDVRSSSTALLFLLFTDPIMAGKEYGTKCVKIFGEDVVRKAVLKTKGSDKQGAYDVLRTFDENKFAKDKPPSFKVGDRVAVKGLKKNKYLNGKPGFVEKAFKGKKTGSYLVVLDVDKPGIKPHPINGVNLETERPSQTRSRGQPGRYGAPDSSSDDSDSSISAPPRPSPRKQKSRGAKSAQKQQAADADDSSMPTLIQEGHKSSSSDDGSTEQCLSEEKDSGGDGSEDMPDLESKRSSAESSDSQDAFPKDKRPAAKKKDAAMPTHVYADQKESESISSDDDESVPPLQRRAPQRGDDSSSSSSSSSKSTVPGLLSGTYGKRH